MYAFLEFEDERDAEVRYHLHFSQSDPPKSELLLVVAVVVVVTAAATLPTNCSLTNISLAECEGEFTRSTHTH